VSGRLKLLDMETHHVAVLQLVAQLGEPQGVPPRAATYVRYDRGRRWQPAQEDLLGPREFQDPLGRSETIALLALLVVGLHLSIWGNHKADPA